MDQAPHIIKVLESQLAQRLEKLWRVFSWCSSILISITAGVIALPLSHKVVFSLAQKCVISSIILILTVYGYLWIDENLKMETLIRNEMEKIFEAESQNNAFQALRPDKAKFGYKAVILSLGFVALVATWMG